MLEVASREKLFRHRMPTVPGFAGKRTCISGTRFPYGTEKVDI